jgi:pimeloyl-ACP methyl ester carboxylesterase
LEVVLESVRVNGLNIAYHRSGDGEPVLFLHGAMADHRIWQVQIDHFARTNAVIAWDGPGAGQSDDPPDGFSLANYSTTLDGLLAEIDVVPAHVVGHSFGGGLAIDFASRYPHRVRSLVLVGGYAGWAGSLPAEEVQARLDGVEEALLTDPAELVEAFMATQISVDAPEETRALVRASIEEFHPQGIRVLSQAFAAADLRDALPLIDVATTVVHGEVDMRASLRVATQLVDSIPGAVLSIIPGVGHESFQEAPEAFNGILGRHLDRVAAA